MKSSRQRERNPQPAPARSCQRAGWGPRGRHLQTLPSGAREACSLWPGLSRVGEDRWEGPRPDGRPEDRPLSGLGKSLEWSASGSRRLQNPAVTFRVRDIDTAGPGVWGNRATPQPGSPHRAKPPVGLVLRDVSRESRTGRIQTTPQPVTPCPWLSRGLGCTPQGALQRFPPGEPHPGAWKSSAAEAARLRGPGTEANEQPRARRALGWGWGGPGFALSLVNLHQVPGFLSKRQPQSTSWEGARDSGTRAPCGGQPHPGLTSAPRSDNHGQGVTSLQAWGGQRAWERGPTNLL